MDQKYQIWFDEISNLTTGERKNEEIKMKLEIHNLELRLFIHQLINTISNLERQVLEFRKVLDETENY
jgi:hypothetical protein